MAGSIMAKADFKWNKAIAEIAKDKFKNEKVATFAATEWRRLLDPFVPFRDGNLSGNVRVAAENGNGVVTYAAGYSVYQYFAYPNKSKAKKPLAAMRWNDAAIAAGKRETLAAEIQSFKDKL